MNLVEHNEDEAEESLLLSLKDDPKGETSAYLDKSATNHMTGDKSKFVELDTSKKGLSVLVTTQRWRLMAKVQFSLRRRMEGI